MDNGKFTIGVFIDFKKAFDTVYHSILVTKLDHYGIRGVAKKWLSSYLENRKQYVCFNGTDSGFLPITCGVPQGSILGPSLFLLYVNDLCNVSTRLTSILFADLVKFKSMVLMHKIYNNLMPSNILSYFCMVHNES